MNFRAYILRCYSYLCHDYFSQEENIHSVRDALEGLSTKEEVSCSSSTNGQEMAIWKQLSLEVLPIILVLHMKRFVYDKSGNKIYKLDKKVDFSVDLEIGKGMASHEIHFPIYEVVTYIKF